MAQVQRILQKTSPYRGDIYMTSIILNSKKIQKTLSSEKTLSDLYNYIMSEYANPDEVFSKILVDGKSYTDDEEKDLFRKKIEAFKTIEFDLKNKYDLAFDAIDCSVELIDSLIAKIQKSIAHYQCNDIESGNILFRKLLSHLTYLFNYFQTCITH